MVEVLLTIDIATIVSAIKLCIDIGETVLDNRKAVGELVDQLKIVHGLLKLLNPEAEKKANEYGLCDILKILNYITKKSSKIFNRLSRPEIIEKIQNIFWSSKFKKDLQRYTSGTLNVVASLNLLFNIMIANERAKSGSTLIEIAEELSRGVSITMEPDQAILNSLSKEAEMFAQNPTDDYAELDN